MALAIVGLSIRLIASSCSAVRAGIGPDCNERPG
jgi:hypothetical protein